MYDTPLPLPPPRTISRQMWWRIHLGGLAMVVGWGFLGGASLSFWSEGGRDGVYALAYLRGDVARVEAQITAKEGTGTTINSRRVFAYRYAFEVDDRRYQGAIATHRAEWQIKDRLLVDYARAAPARSLPAEISRGPTSFTWLGIAAVALATMAWGLVPARQAIERLRHAAAARATDDPRDDDDSEDRWIAFDAGGQRRRIKTQLGVSRNPRPIVLYRREIAGDGMAMRDLPGAPDIDARGELRPDGLMLARCLLAPTLVLAFNAYALWDALA